jgi:3-hydroxyisobutyrate dehydrogenase-like beta-hydroxyacid dehydrogenase
MKAAVGIIGVGLMGHGIARNVLKHGFALTALEHPGNQPLDELQAGGATTQTSARAVAQASDVVILCVTGSPEVETVLTGEDGVLAGLRPGAIVVDCSTAIPTSSERMAALVRERGGRFVDAPMTRSVQHAHEGKLNLLVGGVDGDVTEVLPVLRCFAENIVRTGATGSGHRMKLLHNFVSLGSVALMAEAAACAQRGGIAMPVLVEVLATGGGGGIALERLKPYLLNQDASGLQFFMANALKDLGYYVNMAADEQAQHAIADAVAGTYDLAVQQGGPRKLVPELVSLLAGH